MKICISCLAYCVIVTLFASGVSAERGQKKVSKKGKKGKRGRDDLPTSLPMCTGSDPITNGAPFDVPPHLVHVNNTIIFPPASPAFKFNGFEWTDASAGMVDINLNFQIENFYKGRYEKSADWCNTKGAKFFRITVHGMCLHKSDDEFMYIKTIMGSQLSDECSPQPKIPGTCRLLRLSKNAPGSWTEYQEGAYGGGFEWLHDGEALGMHLFYSSCPDEADEKFKLVKATFDV